LPITVQQYPDESISMQATASAVGLVPA